ncbi:MAG: hypothetical protein LUD01_08065 [Clostridiales bacterium]|nr:hypothetical protein [Clostridiales bacterium]
MTANIRFCGGCNPRYDRGAFARRMIDQYPEIQFIYNAGEDTDIVILLCGCSAACARVPENYGACGRITVCGAEAWENVQKFLDGLIS